MVCAACHKRGKPDSFGSDPKCAFPDGGPFTADNWNCATLNAIRAPLEEIVLEGAVHDRVIVQSCFRDSDQTNAMINLYDIDGELSWPDGDCLFVSWYKQRGSTTAMWLLASDSRDGTPHAPTEADVLLIAKVLARDAEWAASPEGVAWRERHSPGRA